MAEAEKAEGVADATAATAGARSAEAAEEEVPDNSVTYEDYLKARKREGEAFEELAPAAVDTSSGDYKGKAFVSKTELADFSNPVGDAGLEGGRKQRRQRRRGDGRTDIGDFATSALGFVTDSSELPRGRPAGRGPRPDGARGPRPEGARGPRAGGARGPRAEGTRGPRGEGRGGARGPRAEGARGPRPEGARGPRGEGRGGARGPRTEGARGPRGEGRGGARTGFASRGGARAGGARAAAPAPAAFPGLGALGSK